MSSAFPGSLKALGCSISSPDISQSNCCQVSARTSSEFLGQRNRPCASMRLYRSRNPSPSQNSALLFCHNVCRRKGTAHACADPCAACPARPRRGRQWTASCRCYLRTRITPIIREELLFEKFCVKTDVCRTSDNTSQITITHISLLYITTIRRYCYNARTELFI